jgi:hypothetical protein
MHLYSVNRIQWRAIVPFPEATAWNRDSADIARENTKRKDSPCSFFFSQGRSLVLAAEYFHDGRLSEEARGGVALKHRHKIQLAIFGQLMAAFEYMLKDFVAKSIDAANIFDEKLKQQEWLSITTERVLSQRIAQSTIGSMLVHPTLGWHSPKTVNERYKAIYNVAPFDGDDLKRVSVLWVLRHSVAHNAGLVTANDSARINQPALAEKVAHIDENFIKETFAYLCSIAERLADSCGKSMLRQWLKSMRPYGQNWERDQNAYQAIKWLGAYVGSRSQELPTHDDAVYSADWTAVKA